MTKNDHYHLLGIRKSASADEIKAAFRRLAKKWHPDRNPNDSAADLKFRAINEAYEILSDSRKRAEYDSGAEMTLDGLKPAYDPSNVFAKILRGELPAHKVYEDADTLAFMDIMPRCAGHTLVIPRTPARNVLDASPAQLAAVMGTVKTIAKAMKPAFGADGVSIMQYNEPAGGQVVFHLHVHVIPRWDGVKLGPHTGQMEKPDVLAAHAAKLKAALAAK